MISERKEILICCAHEQILQTLLRVIKEKTSLNPIGCSDIHQLSHFLSKTEFQYVLIGSGFSKSDEIFIKEQSIAHRISPSSIILHYGGGSGLLFAEIRQAEEAVNGVTV